MHRSAMLLVPLPARGVMKMAHISDDRPIFCVVAVVALLKEPLLRRLWYCERHYRNLLSRLTCRNLWSPVLVTRNISMRDATRLCQGLQGFQEQRRLTLKLDYVDTGSSCPPNTTYQDHLCREICNPYQLTARSDFRSQLLHLHRVLRR